MVERRRGAALVMAVMALIFMAAVGLAFALWLSSQSRQTARHAVIQKEYGYLEAATERAIQFLTRDLGSPGQPGHEWGSSDPNKGYPGGGSRYEINYEFWATTPTADTTSVIVNVRFEDIR